MRPEGLAFSLTGEKRDPFGIRDLPPKGEGFLSLLEQQLLSLGDRKGRFSEVARRLTELVWWMDEVVERFRELSPKQRRVLGGAIASLLLGACASVQAGGEVDQPPLSQPSPTVVEEAPPETPALQPTPPGVSPTPTSTPTPFPALMPEAGGGSERDDIIVEVEYGGRGKIVKRDPEGRALEKKPLLPERRPLDKEDIMRLVKAGKFDEILERAKNDGVKIDTFDRIRELGKLAPFGLDTRIVGLDKEGRPDMFLLGGVLVGVKEEEINTTDPDLSNVKVILVYLAFPDEFSPTGTAILPVLVGANTSGNPDELINIPLRDPEEYGNTINFFIKKLPFSELITYFNSYVGVPVRIRVSFSSPSEREIEYLKGLLESKDPNEKKKGEWLLSILTGSGFDLPEDLVAQAPKIKSKLPILTRKDLAGFYFYLKEREQGGDYNKTFPEGVLMSPRTIFTFPREED